MGRLSAGILLISILAKKGHHGGSRKKNVKRCEKCAQVMVRTGSSYRCKNCNPDPGGRVTKAVDGLIERVRPAGPSNGDLA
jgi:hypothetical protein